MRSRPILDCETCSDPHAGQRTCAARVNSRRCGKNRSRHSLHSYLILAYAGSEKAAEDVGFYYAANAMGRLFGILLSGVLYQIGGMTACL